MELSDESDFSTVTQYPEYIVLNYLTWISEVLNCEKSWNIDSVCVAMEQLDLDVGELDDVELHSFEDSVNLDSAELKKVLLSDSHCKNSLGDLVKVILGILRKKIENFKKGDHLQTMEFVKVLSNFAKACENNNIIVVHLKKHFKKFLNDLLLCILGIADSKCFTAKGPVYQLIIKVIVSFKNIDFVRSFIIVEISRRLKSFYTVMVKTPTNKFDIHLYEILLLYLTVLKEVLEYNLQKLLLTPVKSSKKEDNILLAINETLCSMHEKLPNYIAVAVHDCLMLFF